MYITIEHVDQGAHCLCNNIIGMIIYLLILYLQYIYMKLILFTKSIELKYNYDAITNISISPTELFVM